MIGCLGPMVGTVVVAVIPPGPSAQMAIAEAAGPCPEDTAFCRERNPPMPTRGDNGPMRKKKVPVHISPSFSLESLCTSALARARALWSLDRPMSIHHNA